MLRSQLFFIRAQYDGEIGGLRGAGDQNPPLPLDLERESPGVDPLRRGKPLLESLEEFAEGSAKLTGGGKRAVASVAALLKRDARIRRVQVGAHTDNTGDEGALRALSLQQAQAVKAALVSRGVAADRITVQGFGPDKPIAPNVSARGRARNRRVELDVLEMAP